MSATVGDAPRSAAASSYCRPIENSRPADDHDHEGDRESDVPEDLGERAGADEREDVREDEEKRDSHDDLRRHEGKEHEEVRGPRTPPGPPRQADREQNSDRAPR